MHIVQLCANKCIIQPVKCFIITFKSRIHFDIGVNHCDIVNDRILRHLYITECLPSEVHMHVTHFTVSYKSTFLI
ncbi:hypothetical protein SDC9_100133 [bioreactor metagenome]|uniref:Uncharacterized protein n=1 Tax=bioreactor metagenome TaxID=1076179 RepID=A0A645AKA5_9ZZZZ